MAHTCNCVIAHKITQERMKEISKVRPSSELRYAVFFFFLQAAELVEKIRLLGGLVIKDRSYHFKTYKTCFVGELLIS